VAGAAFLRGAGSVQRRQVAVLACNVDIVEAFQLCQQTVVGAGFGLLWNGVCAAEIRAACDLVGTPPARRQVVAEGCSYMGEIQAAEINGRAKRR